MQTLICHKQGPALWVTLNRAPKRNALNPQMIAELTSVLTTLHQDVRWVILTGAGSVFCAGADIANMRAMGEQPATANQDDAQSLARLLRTMANLPQVLIAQVNGHALGGALGLLACCDWVVAQTDAQFGFTEVRLGLAPAVIAPYVLRRTGATAIRRYMLTGELFGASVAESMHLVDTTAPLADLPQQVAAYVDALAASGPMAMQAIKTLLRVLPEQSSQAAELYTVQLLSQLRVSPEAQEGLTAFLQKRPPKWRLS